MRRIVIIRGQHPNEVSAYYLAPLVANYLEQIDYQVELIRVPFELTPFGWISGRGTYDDYCVWKKDTIKYDPNVRFFNFHNYGFHDSKKPNLHYDSNLEFIFHTMVEIPAVYKWINNPIILEKAESWSGELPLRPGYQLTSVGEVLLEDVKKYVKTVVDMKASRKQGLVEDLVEEIGRKIIEWMKV